MEASGRRSTVGRRGNVRKFIDRARRVASSSRKGVSIFVNYVNKRIHPRSPREAFEDFGKVLDVYVSYNNSRRLGMRSTFAFVRFSILQEVDAAKVVKGQSYRDALVNKVAGSEGTSPMEVSKDTTSHVNRGSVEALQSVKNGGGSVDHG
ncbi:hypothetical protein V6N12_069147 [Hibiscus sabdariffa]|uniref:RRM domain-containing protein n=1 Tax=Hibiscus sabdariffa TaxID=183260 RepID=A0ABR2FCZ9_9ROSI